MMEGKPKNLGRAYLVDKLRERGLSRRDSVRVLNVILEEMAKALRRGERVEFPLGALRRVRHQSVLNTINSATKHNAMPPPQCKGMPPSDTRLRRQTIA